MINFFLNVETIFMTDLHCLLLCTLLLVYLPLGNQQFVKIPSGKTLKIAVLYDGLAYILVLKELKYNGVFTSNMFLGIMSYALKPMKPRLRTSVLTPFHLCIWLLQAWRKLFGNEGHEGNFLHDKASFTPTTFQEVGFSFSFFWKIMAQVYSFSSLLEVSLFPVLYWDRESTYNRFQFWFFSKRTVQHMDRLQRAGISSNLLKTLCL